MGSVRPPAVAGAFYPAGTGVLRSAVDGLLAAEPAVEVEVDPVLLIVPHAGYAYSGPVAATAYRLLQAATPTRRRVILVGPSHFVAVPGVVTAGATGLETPLGVVAVDTELAAVAEAQPVVAASAAAHAREHSLEVQLPFLQRVVEGLTVLPLLTGDVDPGEVAAVLEAALDVHGTMAVISTDLSHYLGAAAARRRDAATAAAIAELRADDIGWDDACGRVGLQAGLAVARRRGWTAVLLDLRNSGDAGGPKDRVVGYGAFAVGPLAA